MIIVGIRELLKEDELDGLLKFLMDKFLLEVLEFC